MLNIANSVGSVVRALPTPAVDAAAADATAHPPEAPPPSTASSMAALIPAGGLHPVAGDATATKTSGVMASSPHEAMKTLGDEGKAAIEGGKEPDIIDLGTRGLHFLLSLGAPGAGQP